MGVTGGKHSSFHLSPFLSLTNTHTHTHTPPKSFFPHSSTMMSGGDFDDFWVPNDTCDYTQLPFNTQFNIHVYIIDGARMHTRRK